MTGERVRALCSRRLTDARDLAVERAGTWVRLDKQRSRDEAEATRTAAAVRDLDGALEVRRVLADGVWFVLVRAQVAS